MKIQHFCLALGLTTIGSATSIFSPIATLPAKALTWTLSNVRFNDGGVATGSFDYNAASNIYSDINVTITGPLYQDYFGEPINFTSPDSYGFAGPSSLIVYQFPTRFSLDFSSDLNDTGGTRNLSDAGYGFMGDYYRGGTGSVTSTAVPFEFNSGQGIALGLPLFIGLRMLKKRRALKNSTREVHEMVRSRVNLSRNSGIVRAE